MRKKIFVLIVLVVFLVVITGCQKKKQAENYSPPEAIRPTHASIFISKNDFYDLLAKRESSNSQVEGRVVSGIVPHHLLASNMIIDFFNVLAKQKPSLVILIGPNHYQKGNRISSSLYDWQTPAGVVQVNQDICQDLISQGIVAKDEPLLAEEHSVGALMPFIKYFIPEAKVVPIIIQHGATLQEVDELLDAIAPYLDEDAVLLASVDFSHYLTRSEAQLKDQITLQAMEKFDYTALFKMGDDHLDSPASLACSFRWAERRGIKKFHLLDNTNSGIIMRNEVMETTSYFTLVFTEQE